MASTYGVYMDDRIAQEMVERWRAANPWAETFWNQLWDAAQGARRTPGIIYPAGRVQYRFEPDYLGGTLVCKLPDDRFLYYPQMRDELREVEAKDGSKELKWQVTYRKGHGRAAMWRGKLCENVVQATAGSLLRAKLTRLEEEALFPAVAHTHDDIVIECLEASEKVAKDYLKEVMEAPEPWSGELPLAAKAEANWWWTKRKS